MTTYPKYSCNCPAFTGQLSRQFGAEYPYKKNRPGVRNPVEKVPSVKVCRHIYAEMRRLGDPRAKAPDELPVIPLNEVGNIGGTNAGLKTQDQLWRESKQEGWTNDLGKIQSINVNGSGIQTIGGKSKDVEPLFDKHTLDAKPHKETKKKGVWLMDWLMEWLMG